MTVSTIGSTGDYATVPLWAAAAPSDITASGTNENWEGELENQIHTSSSTTDFTGTTTDETHRFILRCKTGDSFRDDTNVLTNPHRIDTSKGASITATGYGTNLFNGSTSFVTLQDLQVYASAGQASINLGYNFKIDHCKFQVTGNRANFMNHFQGGDYNDNSICTNSLFIGFTSNNTNTYGIYGRNYQFINCRFLALSANANSRLIRGAYGKLRFKNCSFFNYPSIYNGDSASEFINCATDLSNFNPAGTQTNCLFNLTVSNEIVASTSSATTVNARTKTTSTNVKSGGVNLHPLYTFDLDGVTRPSSGAWDIGCDYVSSGGGGTTVVMTISESIAAADESTGKLSAILSFSESAGASDLDQGQYATSQEILEAVQTNDLTTSLFKGLLTQSLSALASDAVSFTTPGIILTIGETIASSDNLSISANFKMTIGESANLTDSASSKASLISSIAESISGSDRFNRSSAFSLTISESVIATDLMSALNPNLLGQITATISIDALIGGTINLIPTITGTIKVT